MTKEILIVGNYYKWFKLNIKKYVKFRRFDNIIWSVIHFYIVAISGFHVFLLKFSWFCKYGWFSSLFHVIWKNYHLILILNSK